MSKAIVLQIKATCYNPVQKKNLTIKVKDSYKLISMPLRGFGDCFKLDVSKEVRPYEIYTYENVGNGSASIQSALDLLNDSDKHHCLNNVEQWTCGKDNQMFDLI